MLTDHQAHGCGPLVVRGPQVENRCCRHKIWVESRLRTRELQ